jgi:hypothetical protein
VQQSEHPPRAVGGAQVEVRHTPPEHRVSLAEVVLDVQTRQHGGEPLARLVHAQQLGHCLTQGLEARVGGTHERDLRHRVAQHACSDRMAL